jgi:methyl-accepting chemotaxis protein
MDNVVQQNAASAEESSSAAQEMSIQADSMHTLVQDLVDLVGGNVLAKTDKGRKGGRKSASTSIDRNAAPTATSVNACAKPEAERMIPFDDHPEFSDF